MLIALLLINTAALLLLAVLAATGKLAGPAGPAGERGPQGEAGRDAVVAPASQRSDLVHVLKRKVGSEEWAHFGYAALDSTAHHAALKRPGYAAEHNGVIDEGVQ